MYLSHFYLYLSSRHCFLCMLSDSDLSICMYLLRTYCRSFNSFMLLVITCTCMPEPHHLIMHTCDYLSTPLGFIICTRGIAYDNPGFSCPDSTDRTLVALLYLIRVCSGSFRDDRSAAEAWIVTAALPPSSSPVWLPRPSCYSRAPLSFFISLHILYFYIFW